MKIIWAHRECGAREVIDDAGREHGWAPSTVKTLLRRLVDKGALKTKAVGGNYLYRPAESALSSLRKAADQLLDHAIDGTVGPLVAYMVKKGQLNPGEIAQLRQLLDAHDKDASENDTEEPS